MENAKIYKLVNDVDNKIYIGSSTYAYLASRMNMHRQTCKDVSGRRNTFLYNHMREIGVEHCQIEILERVICENKQQLREREQYWIDKLKPELNMFRAIPADKEYYKERRNKETARETQKKYYNENKEALLLRQKIYAINNKEKIAERKKAYREKHLDEIKAKRMIKTKCECGIECCKQAISRHLKTKQHLDFIKNKKEESQN
jgi:group I intron endonuclease